MDATTAPRLYSGCWRVARGEVPEPGDFPTRTAHPPWLIDRWTRTFGAERGVVAVAREDPGLIRQCEESLVGLIAGGEIPMQACEVGSQIADPPVPHHVGEAPLKVLSTRK